MSEPNDDEPRATENRRRSEPLDRRPTRWGRLAVALLVVVAAAVWFAPALAARTGLRHTVLHRLAPDFAGDLRVGRADLGWLDPVELHDVAITASGGGDPPLTAAVVRTDRPLHALLAAAWGGDGPADLGTITLVRPTVRAAVRHGGSDVEDLLAPLLTGGSAGPSPAFAVAIEDGTATLAGPGGRTLELTGLNATARFPAGSALPDRADVTADLGDGERSGPLTAALAADGDASRWTLSARALPLAAAGPLAVRFGPEGGAWSLGGAVSADLAGTSDGAGWTAGGAATGERLAVRSAAWPAGDRLLLATAALDGELASDDDGVTARGLEFRSAPVTLAADGPLPFALPNDPAALLDADRRLAGTADLARLAELVPGLLGLREGVRIDGGELAFTAETAAAPDPGSRRLTAAADLAGLRATVPGIDGGGARTVSPDGPVSARLAATRPPGGPIAVDELIVRADGLAVVGRGTADDLAADVTADLAAFDRTFGDLFALGGRLAGRVEGDVRLRRAAPDRFDAGVRGTATDFTFAPPTGPAVKEQEMTATVTASLVRGAAGAWAAAAPELRATAGEDRFAAVPAGGGGWGLTLAGDLGRWAGRVSPWLDSSSLSLAGDARASAGVRVSPAGVWGVRDLRAEVRGLAIDGPGTRVREQTATFAGAADFDPAGGTLRGRFDLDALDRDGRADVRIRGRDLRYDPAATPPLRSRVVASGEAGRVWGWFPALADSGVRPAGRFAADGTATASAAAVGAAGEIGFTRLAVLAPTETPRGPRWRAAWEEEAATLAGSATYTLADDALVAGPTALTGGGWSAAASGRVDGVTGAMVADLAGTLRTDWATLGPRLGIGGDASIAGVAERPWNIKGPLAAGLAPAGPSSPGPAATVGLGWDRLAAAGLDFGPGDVTAALDDGRVRIDGVDWPCAGGRLRTVPTIDLTGREPVLRLPEGRALAGVRLTPELTRGWLGLVSPLAAGAARADGAFSVDLTGAAVPLADLIAGDARRADAGGRLRVVRADLTPGELTGRLLAAVRGANRLLRGSAGGDLEDVRVTLPTQSVPFRLTGGRVHHEGLTAESGSVIVTTAGSVGLDGTLDLRADVPVGSDLGGRRVSVPVGGTLDAPRIDAARLASRAAEVAVGGMVERERGNLERRAAEEVGRGLDRLFGRD